MASAGRCCCPARRPWHCWTNCRAGAACMPTTTRWCTCATARAGPESIANAPGEESMAITRGVTPPRAPEAGAAEAPSIARLEAQPDWPKYAAEVLRAARSGGGTRLSIVVPCFNEQEVLPETARRLALL